MTSRLSPWSNVKRRRQWGRGKWKLGLERKKKKPVIRAVFQRRNKSNEKNYEIFLNHEIDFRIYCTEVDTDNENVLKKNSTMVQHCWQWLHVIRKVSEGYHENCVRFDFLCLFFIYCSIIDAAAVVRRCIGVECSAMILHYNCLAANEQKWCLSCF